MIGAKDCKQPFDSEQLDAAERLYIWSTDFMITSKEFTEYAMKLMDDYNIVNAPKCWNKGLELYFVTSVPILCN